jgi:CheY-like chemotaxis protein
VPAFIPAYAAALCLGDAVTALLLSGQLVRITLSVLVELGFDVKLAANAKEVLAIVKAGDPIDILFSDVVMPGGTNGARLAVEARRLRLGLKVVLTSGYTASAVAEEHGVPEQMPVLQRPGRGEGSRPPLVGLSRDADQGEGVGEKNSASRSARGVCLNITRETGH